MFSPVGNDDFSTQHEIITCFALLASWDEFKVCALYQTIPVG